MTFLSDVYGGAASDRQIFERSTLTQSTKWNPNDMILADRGIMVQDLVSTFDVYVNTPTTME